MTDAVIVDTPPAPYPGEFVRVVIGSTIHGLDVATTDDVDFMGVCVESADQLLGIEGKGFEQYQYRTSGDNHTPSGPGDIDLTVYGLRKFLHLAARGNPTVLNLLFVPSGPYRAIDEPLADDLRALIPSILSSQVADRFLGYLRSQRLQLIAHKPSPARQRYLVSVGGEEAWDGKYGMHMIRLGIQGVELLTSGQISLPMRGGLRERVRGIREGWYTRDFVLDWATTIEEELIIAGRVTRLSREPDYALLNAWLQGVYQHHWWTTL